MFLLIRLGFEIRRRVVYVLFALISKETQTKAGFEFLTYTNLHDQDATILAPNN